MVDAGAWMDGEMNTRVWGLSRSTPALRGPLQLAPLDSVYYTHRRSNTSNVSSSRRTKATRFSQLCNDYWPRWSVNDWTHQWSIIPACLSLTHNGTSSENLFLSARGPLTEHLKSLRRYNTHGKRHPLLKHLMLLSRIYNFMCALIDIIYHTMKQHSSYTTDRQWRIHHGERGRRVPLDFWTGDGNRNVPTFC